MKKLNYYPTHNSQQQKAASAQGSLSEGIPTRSPDRSPGPCWQRRSEPFSRYSVPRTRQNCPVDYRRTASLWATAFSCICFVPTCATPAKTKKTVKSCYIYITTIPVIIKGHYHGVLNILLHKVLYYDSSHWHAQTNRKPACGLVSNGNCSNYRV